MATGANTAAKSAGILATVRLRAAAIASAAASAVVRGATIAWTVAQWLLNVALSANPIGLVIIAIGLLAAGFVLLWKRSETFRKIVTAAFGAFRQVAITAIDWVTRSFLGFVVDMLNGAAKAFGWVPKLGPKLRTAATEFGKFKDNVNRRLDGLKDQTINVTPNLRSITYRDSSVILRTQSIVTIASAGRSADGGPTSRFFGEGQGQRHTDL